MPKSNNTELRDKVYELYMELIEAEQTKRDLVKAHGENIKRIKAELSDLLKQATETSNTVSE